MIKPAFLEKAGKGHRRYFNLPGSWKNMKCTAENRGAGKLGGSFCRFFEDSGQDVTKRRTTGKKQATKGIQEPHEKLAGHPRKQKSYKRF